ncbi:MAG: DUF84 family protein [Candidatus Saccharimonadia bacterium]
MKIAIGSKNPVKIAAVRQAFSVMWPGQSFDLVASDVPSGVSDQPLETDLTIKGAINRAKTVKVALRPDYAVGIEGGLVKIGNQWFEDDWVAVIDYSGLIGLGGSPRLEIAPALMRLIRQGMSMGEAADSIFGSDNIKQQEGYAGRVTSGVFTRSDVLCDAVITALACFVRPDLFE